MSSIALETPLAASLANSVHAKIVEQGWTQEDDNSLAEYIVLMLANGKTQEQITSELAGELLQDASGTDEFAQWLFEQVATLTGEESSDNAQTAQPSAMDTTSADQSTAQTDNTTIPAAYDTDMSESAPDNAPKGPKGLHGGRAGGRGARGAQNSRTGDSVLHRTRGNDRISTHVRGAPKGPRGGRGEVRPGMQKALNSMNMNQNSPTSMMQNAQQGGMVPMSPQQQMEFMAMMEQQARMMAQFMPGMVQGMNGSGNSNGNFQANGQQNSQGRSLFDRVDNGRGRGGRGRGRGGIAQNGNMRKPSDDKAGEDGQQGDASSQMDVETGSQSQSQSQGNDPSNTVCYFNLRCTNQACPYVHQSPVAPEGTTIDMSTTCTYGIACKNVKCVGKHPSPATKKAHQAEELCKFFPNCANPMCTFKHPSMPLCSYGASCKNKDCRFTHLTTKCRFSPCLNSRCPYQHEAGQSKKFEDYSWTADGAKTAEEQAKEHVSTRKFVDEELEEELVKPESDATPAQSEVIT